jgi:hypothetical protein
MQKARPPPLRIFRNDLCAIAPFLPHDLCHAIARLARWSALHATHFSSFFTLVHNFSQIFSANSIDAAIHIHYLPHQIEPGA